jgi:hypothetical protein
MTDYYVSEHAAVRMIERGLNAREVLAALDNPWLSQPAAQRRTEHIVKFNGTILKVVTVPNKDFGSAPPDATIIVTVVPLTQNGKTVVVTTDDPESP